MAGSSHFALQLVLPRSAATGLPTLAASVAARPDRETIEEKRAFYTAFYARLRELVPQCERGVWCWDTDDAKASAEYRAWCEGTPSDARKHPPALADEAEYAFVTVALLVADSSRASGTLRALCSVAEAENWYRSTFDRLLRELHKVDPASTRGDAVFVRPRDADAPGVAASELALPKYAYLRPLVDR